MPAPWRTPTCITTMLAALAMVLFAAPAQSQYLNAAECAATA
jgi:hypothetical protein